MTRTMNVNVNGTENVKAILLKPHENGKTIGPQPTSDTNNNAETAEDDNYLVQDYTYDHDKEKIVVESTLNFEDLVWRNIIIFVIMHGITFIGLIETVRLKLYYLFLFHFVLGVWCGIGVTGGAHRLWSHRTYKAKLPLRIFLAMWFIMAGQNDIYEWSRDHRTHHKFSETDADPHNSKRGFFFAHMGWLCCKKHPEVIRKGKTIDMSDLLADPVVRFQKEYYPILFVLTAFVIPTAIPHYFFNVPMLFAFGANWIRYTIMLHCTWLVNSAAHFYGSRDYNDKINPRESPFVIYVTPLGEGFHNYHHTFPFDYKASEYGMRLNLTTLFINIMAYFGQAYDLKTVDQKIVDKCKANVLARAKLAQAAKND